MFHGAACCITKRIWIYTIFVFSLVMVAGCTPPVWHHPEQKNPLNFQQDIRQCNEEAAKYTAEMKGDVKKSAVKERQKECMKTKGYGWGKVNDVPDDSYVYEDKEQP